MHALALEKEECLLARSERVCVVRRRSTKGVAQVVVEARVVWG